MMKSESLRDHDYCAKLCKNHDFHKFFYKSGEDEVFYHCTACRHLFPEEEALTHAESHGFKEIQCPDCIMLPIKHPDYVLSSLDEQFGIGHPLDDYELVDEHELMNATFEDTPDTENLILNYPENEIEI